MPILPVVTVDSFDEGLDVCLMLEAGLHHTATMHSLNMERLNRMARKMKTSILLRMVRPMQGLDLVVRVRQPLQLLHLLGIDYIGSLLCTTS